MATLVAHVPVGNVETIDVDLSEFAVFANDTITLEKDSGS